MLSLYAICDSNRWSSDWHPIYSFKWKSQLPAKWNEMKWKLNICYFFHINLIRKTTTNIYTSNSSIVFQHFICGNIFFMKDNWWTKAFLATISCASFKKFKRKNANIYSSAPTYYVHWPTMYLFISHHRRMRSLRPLWFFHKFGFVLLCFVSTVYKILFIEIILLNRIDISFQFICFLFHWMKKKRRNANALQLISM